MSTEKDKNSQEGGNRPGRQMNFYWIYAIIGAVLIGMLMLNSGSGGQRIQYEQFVEYAEQGKVKRLTQNGERAQLYLTPEAREGSSDQDPMLKRMYAGPDYWFFIPPGDEYKAEIKRLQREQKFEHVYEPVNEWGQQIITWIIFLGILIAVWVILMRRLGGGGAGGGQIFNIGKSKAQLFEKGKGTNTTFDDVAGLDGAKEELQEIVDFLKKPGKYTELGAKIPKGALLVGPPGTGKTLLAKAVAGEAQVPFFSLSGSDFVEMFVGVGASRVRDLFKQAKEKAPAIIFIDEIDAIGRARGKNVNMGSNDERENTLNQLLTEMDGFGTNTGVIILAATNRADILDKALMRAGRFDRQIYVDLPDLNERKAIFDVHLRPIKTDRSIDVDFLARQTPGFSGADIANICNEAALIAARKSREVVTKEDFLDAVDRVVGGLEKKNKIVSPREKETIAFHEAGHATVSWLLEHASPLVKVTIVPRGQSLGAAWYLPEERQITTTEQIFDEMCAAMGGRAAEEIVFGKVSTGALSDLEKVTKQAYAMVSIYGLNKRIGNRSYYDRGGDSAFVKPYSEETARIIDEEASKIIEMAYERAKTLLTDNREKLDRLAKTLLEREVIFKEDLIEIIGKRPFDGEETYPVEKDQPEDDSVTETPEEKATEAIPTAETEDAPPSVSADSGAAEAAPPDPSVDDKKE